jgi:hypothetical protein
LRDFGEELLISSRSTCETTPKRPRLTTFFPSANETIDRKEANDASFALVFRLVPLELLLHISVERRENVVTLRYKSRREQEKRVRVPAEAPILPIFKPEQKFRKTTLLLARLLALVAHTSTSSTSLFQIQAIEKWGTWGQIAPGVDNGQSEIKLTKLQFSRPAAVAAQYQPDEGFTGLVQVSERRGGGGREKREMKRKERKTRTSISKKKKLTLFSFSFFLFLSFSFFLSLFPSNSPTPPTPSNNNNAGGHLRGRGPRPHRPPHRSGHPLLLHQRARLQDQVPPGQADLPEEAGRLAEGARHLL